MVRSQLSGRRWEGLPVVLTAVALLTGCGSTAAKAAADTSTSAASSKPEFCRVYPAFAEKLNMALANANPDARQYTVIEPILADLAPSIRQLRSAEPPALKGTVDKWVSEMHRYATGNYPVTAAESARSRMSGWVKANC